MKATVTITEEEKKLRGESIATAICDAFGYRLNEITQHDRKREKSDLRHMICRVLTDMELTSAMIGSIIKRDHSTVLASLREFENQIQTNQAFAKRYERSLVAAKQNPAYLPCVYHCIMKYDGFDRQYIPVKDGFTSYGAAWQYLIEEIASQINPNARGQYFIDKYLQI